MELAFSTGKKKYPTFIRFFHNIFFLAENKIYAIRNGWPIWDYLYMKFKTLSRI